jgi:hypothetical protein
LFLPTGAVRVHGPGGPSSRYAGGHTPVGGGQIADIGQLNGMLCGGQVLVDGQPSPIVIGGQVLVGGQPSPAVTGGGQCTYVQVNPNVGH